MAIKTTIPILLSLTAVLFAADVCMAATAPVPAADCSSIILDMADCLTYVSGDATVKKPEGNCCSGLKKVLKTHAECLCEAFKNAAQFGVTLNMTRALDLPSACRVSAPPVSDCGLSIGTGGIGSPAISPVGRPTSIEGANEIVAPVPAPGTSGSASLTAQAFESLVFALVVASFSFN
ncbi:non-specific lipid transfer protein GPI-anchored 11-like [Rhododendron vialii]|uniref:non-specific lipid transfer protein GPI-anchored 11-like n=1 Tax=Rhododendron vialii TaxID=182163 RepID=UPI00265E2A32|nr:non-specific lipid transfer protein GPI-anchored 11-like [Rhododendron vialii]